MVKKIFHFARSPTSAARNSHVAGKSPVYSKVVSQSLRGVPPTWLCAVLQSYDNFQTYKHTNHGFQHIFMVINASIFRNFAHVLFFRISSHQNRGLTLRLKHTNTEGNWFKNFTNTTFIVLSALTLFLPPCQSDGLLVCLSDNLLIHLSSSLSDCMTVYLMVCSCVRLSLRPSVRLSLRPSVRLSLRPSVRLSLRPSVRLSLCPSVRLSLCPSVSLSVCPSVRLSVCPSVRLSVCLSVYLTACLPILHFLLLFVCLRINLFAFGCVFIS